MKNIFKASIGFTLIELLVAMAIIGALATMATGNYLTVKKKGRDVQRKHDLEQIQRALEMYYNDYGQYPDASDLPSPGDPWEDASGTLYIKTMPPDPKNYVYWYETDNTSYKLFAFLENDQDPDIESCVVALGINNCNVVGEVCNYAVSSVNLDICKVPYP